MTDPSRLGPDARRTALDGLAGDDFDIVVIGGGVTGAGVTLDAATRGLAVALVEQRDLASGTSSRSSKLIHGGLRYLEQRDFGLVMEALRERSLMLGELAPHLVEPVPFLYPLQHRIWERAYVGAGVFLYDLLAGLRRNPLPRHRHLSRRRALELMPALRPDTLVGGILYHDAQVDDARHTMTVARTAASLGAVVTTSVRATGLIERSGKVCGVRAVCLETGRRLAIEAAAVISATGVWTDDVEEMIGAEGLHVTASKGIHLVVPRDRIDSGTGMIIRTERSVLFLIPWNEHWIIGTTDTPWALDLAHPAASRADIEYLLSHVNSALETRIGPEDVVGVYAGLRPLLTGESEATSRLSREHAVSVPHPGLVSIAGGKYTTYRVMARDAVEAAAGEIGRTVPPSATERTPLVGAAGFAERWAARAPLARRAGLPIAAMSRLLRRYGDRVDELIALMEERPDLGRRIPGGGRYLEAEVVYATTHEAALHLDDVLTRRTRISIEVADRGIEASSTVSRLMGEVLGWSPDDLARELEHYRARVHAEVESQQMPDDRTADAARMGAPDVRTLGA